MRSTTPPRRALLTTTAAITEALADATEAYDVARTFARTSEVENELDAAFVEQVRPLLATASAVTRRAGS